MAYWLLDRLFDRQDQPKPRFAFQGTVNWMRALAILVDTSEFSQESLGQHYSTIQRRPPNVQADTLAYEALLMSLHNVACLNALASGNQAMPYNVVRAGIVSWYYAIYYACKSMLGAASGADPQTHGKTARSLHTDIVSHGLLIGPFGLHLDSITPTAVDTDIARLRGSNFHDLNITPSDAVTAYGGLLSYLKGTAEYERWRIEEKIRNTREFKALGVENFRTKTARELRDGTLSREKVNFLVQAFRYRGKANYRDSIYLSYGDDRSEAITNFTSDLQCVARRFVEMCCHYVSRRTERGTWQAFVEDIRTNARFTISVEVN